MSPILTDNYIDEPAFKGGGELSVQTGMEVDEQNSQHGADKVHKIKWISARAEWVAKIAEGVREKWQKGTNEKEDSMWMI